MEARLIESSYMQKRAGRWSSSSPLKVMCNFMFKSLVKILLSSFNVEGSYYNTLGRLYMQDNYSA